MFHSAALKLTIWYLVIIMGLSIGLSAIIYHLSRNELIDNTRRQVYFLSDELGPRDYNRFSNLREQQLDEAIRRLKGNLLAFNFMVLLAGGAASYLLARRTLDPIEEALEAQKRFTGDASHELRTPLTVIQAENEVALRKPNLTQKEATQLLRSNLEEVAKLKALSDGLLRLSSTEARATLNQVISLKSVANEALQRSTKLAGEKKIKIKKDLTEIKAHGDWDSLVELVYILIDNALKYSPEGSHITVKTYRKDRHAWVSVADEGEGIEAADLPRIFERFYRASGSSTKAKADGHGLGLAIAKRIAEVHDGSLHVKSAPGKGSTFTVRLPAV